MVEKHDIFFMIFHQRSSPPVPFPESIITGFGFSKPTFMNFTSSLINFTEINTSDAKCIQIWWTGDEHLPLMIKTPNETIIDMISKDINIYQRNIMYQQFIKVASDRKFRVCWSKKTTVKIISFDSALLIRKKPLKIPKIIKNRLLNQLRYIMKTLNKELHFAFGYELEELVLDFIQSSELYCLGIHSFSSTAIISLHKIQSFPSLFAGTSSSLLNLSKVSQKETKKRPRKIRPIANSNCIEQVKNLSRQMRVIMGEHKARSELFEGLRGQVDGILAHKAMELQDHDDLQAKYNIATKYRNNLHII